MSDALSETLNDTVFLKESEEGSAAGKRAAGQNPAKREQILDGAKRCFLAEGFEAASMNEITAHAGVSKGTIYVYFQNKEDLFAALIDRERGRLLASAETELDPSKPVAEALRAFGIALATHMTADETIRCQRMVLGIIERMPRIATRFFSQDQTSAITILCRYFEAKAAEGLLHIDDRELAASQFLALCNSWLHKSRLFGNRTEPWEPADVARVVDAAVAMFLRHYSTGPIQSGTA